MLDILKRISTKSVKIDSFNPATDEEMHKLEHILREIQPDFNLREMIMKSKVELSGYKKFHEAIKDHCVLGHYMFSFKKCSNTNCSISDICKNKHIEGFFASLHRLPFPMPKITAGKFKHFNEVYGSSTTQNHRPSLIEKEKSSHQMPFSPSSQAAKNTNVVVQCDECGKWRCMYSKLKLKKVYCG